MALNTRGTSSSNKTYLNIFQGNIVLEYDTQDALISKLDSLGLEYAEEIAETNRGTYQQKRLTMAKLRAGSKCIKMIQS